jgi:hypothetical protein
MRTVFDSPARGLGVVRLADFVAGLVRHHDPRFFTRLTSWQSSCEILLLSALPRPPPPPSCSSTGSMTRRPAARSSAA